MARKFNDFENIQMMDFIPFTRGYHCLTITDHKEDIKQTKNGDREVDIFELTSDEGAVTNLTLYYMEKAYWTYKKLMSVAGVKVDQMKGNISADFGKLVGKRIGAFVELESVEKWDENKNEYVTRKYPRIEITKIFDEETTIRLMEKYVPHEEEDNKPAVNNEPLGKPVIDEDLPF